MKKIKGLWLWQVHLLGDGDILNIVTTHNMVEQATGKAQTIIRTKSKYRGCQIKSVESQGTIDA